MIENLAKLANPILEFPAIRRTRRNHGLEHATVHILAAKAKSHFLAGRSDAAGFWLFGDVDTALVEEAVQEAVTRLRAGEKNLAVHPGCGTARLMTGSMVGLATLAGTIGVKRTISGYFQRLPTVTMLAMGAILVSEPLGMQMQKYITTSGDLGDLEVTRIEKKEIANQLSRGMAIHRISTTSS